MGQDRHGNETPKGFSLVEIVRPDGDIAQFFVEEVKNVTTRAALEEPRNKTQGDEDLVLLSAGLGVSSAEAIRRAVKVALEILLQP